MTRKAGTGRRWRVLCAYAAWLAAAFGLAVAYTPVAPVAAEREHAAAGIGDDIDRCRENPRFRVGGAMIGDCLMEIADAVDERIAATMGTGATRYCHAEDRDDFLRAHADWQAYRTRFCALVGRSPGNTPAYVNSAGCRLELGRQRLVALIYSNTYGSPRCPPQD